MTGSTADVGVIVVTYNSEPCIAACLGSLRAAASTARVRVIVVDNASTDDTVAVALRTWPGIEVKRNRENVGFGRAVNQAVRDLASCSHLLLLNPDAAMTEGSLDLLIGALESSGSAAACGPHLVYPDGRHQISARPLPSLEGTLYDALLLYHLKARPELVEQFPADMSTTEVDCLSGACMLMRLDAFASVGGFDEQFFLYGEDVDLCARLRASGSTLILVPSARVVHVEGASAFQDRAAFFREIHRARAAYVRKHFPRVDSTVARLAQAAGLIIRGCVYPFAGALGRPDLPPQARHQWGALAVVLGKTQA